MKKLNENPLENINNMILISALVKEIHLWEFLLEKTSAFRYPLLLLISVVLLQGCMASTQLVQK